MARRGSGLFENKFERLPHGMAKLSYLVAMVLVAMVLVVFTGFFFSSSGRFLLFVAFKYELITFSVVVDVVSR